MNFKKNMSGFDRIARLIVAALLISIVFIGNIGGILGVLMIIVSVVFSLSSITAICPLYKTTKFSTLNSDDYV